MDGGESDVGLGWEPLKGFGNLNDIDIVPLPID